MKRIVLWLCMTLLLLALSATALGAEVGDYITFGAYEQDNDLTNGTEPIEWLVLAVEDDRMLVISRYGLACQQYEVAIPQPTWEECSLRKWLNEDFLQAAFSAEEQARIPLVTLPAEAASPDYESTPGNPTEDRIFALSYQEAEALVPAADLRCLVTPYARQHGVIPEKGYCWWWLRSAGYFNSMALLVNPEGKFYQHNVNFPYNAARPAMWLPLAP